MVEESSLPLWPGQILMWTGSDDSAGSIEGVMAAGPLRTARQLTDSSQIRSLVANDPDRGSVIIE
jgi:hypothetical protein